MRKVTAELTWLIRLLEDLSVTPLLPVPLHCDSQVAIHIARNPIFYERTKHVDLDCHFVRQQYIWINFITVHSLHSSARRYFH